MCNVIPSIRAMAGNLFSYIKHNVILYIIFLMQWILADIDYVAVLSVGQIKVNNDNDKNNDNNNKNSDNKEKYDHNHHYHNYQ